jgi:hypothetical protein
MKMTPQDLLFWFQNMFGAYMTYVWIVGLVFTFVSIIVFWKVFEKGGKPGWAAIIPIYRDVVLLQMVGRPVWWIVLLYLPVVGSVIRIIVFYFDLAKVFNRSAGFAIGLWFLNPIFMIIMAFDESIQYKGPIAGRPEYMNTNVMPAPVVPVQPVPQQTYNPPRPPSDQRTNIGPAVPARPSKPRVAAWLIDSAGHTIQLYANETTLGRLTENDIQCKDTTVSRRHAKIMERNGHFTIVDLGSPNGTRVNGRRISTPFALGPDDEIQIGDNTVYRFKS